MEFYDTQVSVISNLFF